MRTRTTNHALGFAGGIVGIGGNGSRGVPAWALALAIVWIIL